MARVVVRPLTSLKEFRECERIQKAVWGAVGVTSEVLTVTEKYGGAVFGASVGGRIVGFIYAFLARRKGRLIHWSHMMAVEPGFRDRTLGFRMKLVHRRLALREGLGSICWTFDPLQSRNAALNIHRLGARVEEYVSNCYGYFPSRIERGLASDRFVVNWRIRTAAVKRRLRARALPTSVPSLPPANETRLNSQGFLENRRIHLDLDEPRFLVEIPANTDEMRARALSLARLWRIQIRKVFRRYFSAGYRLIDFVPPGPASDGRCFYILGRPDRP